MAGCLVFSASLLVLIRLSAKRERRRLSLDRGHDQVGDVIGPFIKLAKKCQLFETKRILNP